MATFSLTSVDQTGVEAILANPLPGSDFGSLVGRPVEFARKIVGHVTRIYKDSVGPWVAKVALDDMNALRLSATGCITALNVNGGSVELADRPQDHGSTFEYTKADGEKLCKRFTGLSQFERDAALLSKHDSKLPSVYRRPNANTFVPGFGGSLPMLPSEYRKAMRDGLFRKPGKGAPRVNPNANAR
jgi:hypothetical protein